MNEKVLKKTNAAKDTEQMAKIIIVKVDGVCCSRLPKRQSQKKAHTTITASKFLSISTFATFS
jgi:hypothetical protein